MRHRGVNLHTAWVIPPLTPRPLDLALVARATTIKSSRWVTQVRIDLQDNQPLHACVSQSMCRACPAPLLLPSSPRCQLVKLQVDPICIFLSSKADSALIEACRRPPLGLGSREADPSDPMEVLGRSGGTQVKTERASCFQYSQVSSHVPGGTNNMLGWPGVKNLKIGVDSDMCH